MINHTHTRIEQSRPMPLHSDYLAQTGVTQVVEGMALINSLEDGVGRVRPSTGTDADGTFLGLAAEINRRQTTAVAVETVTVPAASPYTVPLQNDSQSDDITVVTAAGADLPVSTSGPAADNVQWQSANADQLTFHSSHAGNTYTVIYRYSPTLEQAVALFGDGNVQGVASPGEAANVMTVITKGVVFTDQFATGDFWNAQDIMTLHTVANGIISRTGGEAITAGRVQIIQSPSVTVPFLGLLLL